MSSAWRRARVSVWVRGVDFEPRPRRRARKRGPNKLERAKLAEIERFRVEGVGRIGELSDREFLMAGLGLYAGDGSKGGNEVAFANSNPDLIAFWCAWFRRFFEPDEARLRVHLYLHEDLDLDVAEDFWAQLTGIPRSQFHKAYRAAPGAHLRRNRHVHGCCHVRYCSRKDHRRLMGLINGLILVSSTSPFPGVAQLAEHRIVNPQAVGSSPTPGAQNSGRTLVGAARFAFWPRVGR